jgi:hypothetical protein
MSIRRSLTLRPRACARHRPPDGRPPQRAAIAAPGRRPIVESALRTDRRYRKAVSGYLRSQTLPPIALRRPAEQDPDRASRVFARLLGKPRFTWQRDGEALLRRYKAGFFDRTPLPGVTPLSSRQRAFLRSRNDEEGLG